MNLSEVRRRLDDERRQLAQNSEVVDILPDVTRVCISTAHMIRCSSLTAENADAVIVREIEHHRQLGVSFEWKVYAHDQPADLLDRLQRQGLTPGPREAVMVYDLSSRPGWMSESPRGSVRRIERLDQLPDYRRVAEEVFEKDYSFTTTELATALAAGSTGHLGYVGYVDGEPVSIGRLYTHHDSHFAGLYGGGTRRAFRGRGCYRALISARARDAIELGAKYLIVDALPTSRPILERLGFEWLTDTWPCDSTKNDGTADRRR